MKRIALLLAIIALFIGFTFPASANGEVGTEPDVVFFHDDCTECEFNFGDVPFELMTTEQQREAARIVVKAISAYMPNLEILENYQHADDCTDCSGEDDLIPFGCLDSEERQRIANAITDVISNDIEGDRSPCVIGTRYTTGTLYSHGPCTIASVRYYECINANHPSSCYVLQIVSIVYKCGGLGGGNYCY